MNSEKEIMELSNEKFKWKTSGQFEKLADLFDDELIFIHITGHRTTKEDWINLLKSRQFVYEKIEPKEQAAKVYGETAVLVGKAKFIVNHGAIYHLVYTEVYVKKEGSWKLVNLHTTTGF